MIFVNKSQTIPLFFATDDNYAPFLGVTLKSILANASKDYFYKIHVLTSSVSEENKSKINKVLTENSSIEYISVAKEIEDIKGKFHLRDYYSIETYYRFFIADMFPEYDKVLYLDCDITVLGDISNLYFTNISNYLVGAVRDQIMGNFEFASDYTEKYLGIKTKKCFNAGVLLMNTKMFRAYNVLDRLFKLMDRFKFKVTQDQDYLNVICKDKVRYLDLGWNKMPVEEIGFDDVDLQLIHYNLGWKPWHYENIKYEEYFWQYASQTDFYDEILNQLKTYPEEKKLRDKEQFQKLKELAYSEIESDENYKKTIEKENRRHYIKRGLTTFVRIPGIKILYRFLGTQGYKIRYEYTKYRERQNKTFGS